MKKLFLLSFCLALTVAKTGFAASAPAKPVTAKPAAEAAAKPAPAKAATSSAPAAPAMPALPPAAHVQLELVQISQAFLAEFNQAEIAQLGQVFETTLNAALASKEFDQAFVKLLTSVQEMAAVIGSNLSICKEIQVKLNQAVNKASTSFNKLASSGMVPAQTNEFYFIKIANSILAGLKQGLAKAKPSKNACAMPVETAAPAQQVDAAKGKVAALDQKPSAPVAPVK